MCSIYFDSTNRELTVHFTDFVLSDGWMVPRHSVPEKYFPLRNRTFLRIAHQICAAAHVVRNVRVLFVASLAPPDIAHSLF